MTFHLSEGMDVFVRRFSINAGLLYFFIAHAGSVLIMIALFIFTAMPVVLNLAHSVKPLYRHRLPLPPLFWHF